MTTCCMSKISELEETTSSRKHLMREISDGRFVRILKLPTSVSQDTASATNNGLLTISFPKRDEAKPRRIMIEG